MRVWKKEKQDLCPPCHFTAVSSMVVTQGKLEGNRRRYINVRRSTYISNLPSRHFRTAVSLIFPGWRDQDLGLLSSETVIRTKAC